MATRQGGISDLMDFAARLPWEAGCALTSEPMAICEMSWRDFERLVGEAFRHRGFKVTGFGGGRAHGGVDLALMKNGERFLVQCKHWRKEQVGVTVVRELNRVMAAAGAQGGYVLTDGRFTPEAREFAGKMKIELVDGTALRELIGSLASAATAAARLGDSGRRRTRPGA